MHQVVVRGGSRWLLLLVLVAAGVGGLMIEGSRSSAVVAGTPDPAAAGSRAKLDELLEDAEPVASLSTETSRTYRREDGTFVTRIFAQAPAASNGQTVDPTLRPASAGGYTSAGNGTSTSFPSSLTDPVKVERAGAWVSMQLRDAGGAGDPDGSTIAYSNALPGVDVKYRSSSGAIGEELRLTGSAASSSFVFDLRASSGVRAATQHNGTIALSDADGKRVFSLSPSYAFPERDREATQKVSTTLTDTPDGWRITLAVDEDWLRDELAHGPVVVDPTVELQGATKDCALTSDTPNLSFCADDQLWIGWSGDHDHHSLIKWDVSAIPKDAVTLWGGAGLYQPSDYGIPVSKQLTLHRVTRDWTTGASWNTYDGTNAWTTPGGDFDSTPAATATVPANHGGWTEWSTTALVQHWVDGSLPNYGVAIQDKPGPHVTGEEDYHSTEGTIPAQAPELDIVWTPRTGNPDFYTFEDQALDAKTTAGVNAANGNLLLSTNDISAPGNGLDLKLDHYHNSLGDSSEVNGLGIRGTASLGRDVHLHVFDAETVGFSRGDGVTLPFIGAQTAGATTTWTAPPELGAATLSKSTTTNKYTLHLPAGLPSYPGVDLTLTFDAAGKLLDLKDAGGHTVALAYYPQGAMEFPALGGITDSNNVFWDVDRGYIGGERLADITDPAGHHTLFEYVNTSDNYLNKVTAADGSINRYAYDTSHRLKSITTPDGNVTLVTYNGTSSKVATVVRTNNTAHTSGPTTTFTYSAPSSPCLANSFDFTKTVVQRPNNTSTTYCANDHAQITYDTDNPTVATASGEWYDLRDQYTQGTGTHSISLTGADAGSGVKKMALEEIGGAELASATLPCDPRNAVNPTACPHRTNAGVSFDPSGLAEGQHTFRSRTTDYAGRSVVSAPWTVKIDRTPPGAPAEIEQGQFDPGDAAGAVTIGWDDSADPELADGTVGSGLKHYQVRYAINGGAMSAWQTSKTPALDLAGRSIGNVVSVEVAAVDGVGNVSAASTASLTIVPRSEDPLVEDMATKFIMGDIGVSYSQAKAYYDVQQKSGGIGTAVGASNSGPGYAGSWFDDSSRELVVNLKSGTPSSGAQSAIDAAGLTGSARIGYVGHTLDELDGAFDDLTVQLQGLLAAEVVAVNRDEAHSRLVVEVGTDATSQQRAQVEAAAAAASVPVAVDYTSIANFQVVLDSCTNRLAEGSGSRRVPVCDDPLRGGTYIAGYTTPGGVGNGTCTAGFNVTSRSTGKPYVLTAGHCFDGYDNDNSVWKGFTSEADPVEIGPNHNPFINGSNGDAGLITVDEDSLWWTSSLKPAPWVFIQGNRNGLSRPRRQEHYVIRTFFTSLKNETLCWSGATTGGHCGKVSDASSDNRFGKLKVEKGNGATDCIAGGDSGGPVVKGGQARGLAIGHRKIAPCTLLYQSVKLAQDRLNVQVVTPAP